MQLPELELRLDPQAEKNPDQGYILRMGYQTAACLEVDTLRNQWVMTGDAVSLTMGRADSRYSPTPEELAENLVGTGSTPDSYFTDRAKKLLEAIIRVDQMANLDRHRHGINVRSIQILACKIAKEDDEFRLWKDRLLADNKSLINRTPPIPRGAIEHILNCADKERSGILEVVASATRDALRAQEIRDPVEIHRSEDFGTTLREGGKKLLAVLWETKIQHYLDNRSRPASARVRDILGVPHRFSGRRA